MSHINYTYVYATQTLSQYFSACYYKSLIIDNVCMFLSLRMYVHIRNGAGMYAYIRKLACVDYAGIILGIIGIPKHQS